MPGEPSEKPDTHADQRAGAVELPAPTMAPFVLSAGLALLAGGVATSPAFLVVGGTIFVVGIAMWVAQLLPGRGHVAEPLVGEHLPPDSEGGRRATTVRHLEKGMPGYRLRLPEKVHPISAGVRGGIAGGLVMPVPALLYGILSGQGIWYPVNLLTGIVLPGIGEMSAAELAQFHFALTVVAVLIHGVMSVVIGLLYGVLMPTLPSIPKPLAWGGLLMPLMWTAVTFSAMRFVNPLLAAGVDWPWFIASQFLFGVVAAVVVIRLEVGRMFHPAAAGFLGGVAGGVLMPLPAILWALAVGHSLWYPVNLLAGMVHPGMGSQPAAELEQFHPHWFVEAMAIHAVLSLGFGFVYGWLLPRLKPIPGPMAWGGLLLPLLWTATTYGLMGVVNPLLEQRVDWPWFIVSQFIFGLVTAVVVVRSEQISIPPVGAGEEVFGEQGTGRN